MIWMPTCVFVSLLVLLPSAPSIAATPSVQIAQLSTAQWQQDLDRLVTILTTRHGAPFHRISREAFLQEVERVRAAIPGLPPEAIAVEFRRLAALIGDGHTKVTGFAGRPRLPILTFWFEDGLRVTETARGNEKLLGARLVAINGVPAGDVTERLRAYIGQGETEWGFRGAAPYLMRDPDLLARAGIGAGPSYSLTFEGPAKEPVQATLTVSSQPVEWVQLGGERPLSERRPDEAFWTERLPNGAMYLNWRSYDGLRTHVARLMSELEQQRPSALLIDLRDNTGGDFYKGRAFIHEIASRPWLNQTGKLFVLTGRYTFSAAMTNAVDFMKTTKATLIGEPPGAAPNNWQEGKKFKLPNSGLQVSVSTKFYSFLPGEAVLCPSVYIAPKVNDWGKGYDAAVQYVIGEPNEVPAEQTGGGCAADRSQETK